MGVPECHFSIFTACLSDVSYDVTTVYFEVENEDERCRIGFSKDRKYQHPPIVLGLLVSKGGYPFAYDIFKENQFKFKREALKKQPSKHLILS